MSEALLDRMFRAVHRRVSNLVSRAIVQLVDDAAKVQLMQVALLTDETRDQCERIQQFGFTSAPLAGAEAVVLFPGGDRAHALVIAVDDRRYRVTGLQPGECALYTSDGIVFRLQVGGDITSNAAIDLTGAATLKVDGTQVVGAQGAAVADSTANTASVSAQLNLLLARCRAHGLIAT